LDRAKIRKVYASGYIVLGVTPEEEAVVREQIQIMQPSVLPLRVVFVPHWKYVDNLCIFRLRVPKGDISLMFTDLPSRSVFIDADRYARAVAVHETFTRNGRAVLQCGLDEKPGARLLEIPQWMFDSVACCRMSLATAPLSAAVRCWI
jgi:hypothetical protein